MDTPVTFVFDRPMDADAPDNGFSVSPELASAGTFEWQDDHTLLYTSPAEGYARNTLYIFSVKATSQEGTKMPDAFTFRVRSLGYLVVGETVPTNGSEDLATDTVITVFFNNCFHRS